MIRLVIHPRSQRGYIALIAVVIVVAVTLAIGLSMNLLSISETQVGLLRQRSVASFATADACLNEAYLRLMRDAAYAGGNLNLAQGSCTIAVVSLGADRTVTVTSDVGGVSRRIEGMVTISGSTVTQISWKEL